MNFYISFLVILEYKRNNTINFILEWMKLAKQMNTGSFLLYGYACIWQISNLSMQFFQDFYQLSRFEN